LTRSGLRGTSTSPREVIHFRKGMSSFFQQGKAIDPIYRSTSTGVEEHHRQGREYLERAWLECAPYVDSDAAEKATRDLASVFWELHLAYALKFVGKLLVPRNRLAYRNNKGPDLFMANPDVWVEAVVVRPGNGPDALDTNLEFGKVYDYNPDRLVLRMRSVIRDKSTKLRSYFDANIIKAGQSAIVAISGVSLPWRYKYSGCYPPEIVRAVFPANNQVIELDRKTLAQTAHYLEYRDTIQKTLGANVSTDVFLDPTFSHVSAILYDESCWVGQSGHPGIGFKIVHNPHAATPLPDGWYPTGDEYWWENSAVRHQQHRG
jgi:hypothetical protein